MITDSFQIDLSGVVNLFSRHIYTDERIFIRELLQNALDATRLQYQELASSKGRIEFSLSFTENTPLLMVQDNGKGLTEQELRDYVAKFGASDKRTPETVGQFGIGLLSCFVVADEITLVSQSAKADYSVRWFGSADGTFKFTRLPRLPEIGTCIQIVPNTEKYLLFKAESVVNALQHYGCMADIPISFEHEHKITHIGGVEAPWTNTEWEHNEERKAFLLFGKQQFGQDFWDFIPFKTDYGKATGAVYILKDEAGVNGFPNHHVYAKHMLVSDEANNILPQWACFAKCIVCTETLSLTASRTAIHEDEVLYMMREEIGIAIRHYLIELATTQKEKFFELLSIHHRAFESMLLDDDTFFEIIGMHFPFYTNMGMKTLQDFKVERRQINYVESDEVFHQVAQLASAQDVAVINGQLNQSRALLAKAKATFRRLDFHCLALPELIENFLRLDEHEQIDCRYFIKIAQEELTMLNCSLQLKKFTPESLPSIYHTESRSDYFSTMANDTGSLALWGNIMAQLPYNSGNGGQACLCLNYNHPTVRRVIAERDQNAIKASLRILYIEALLMSHIKLLPHELSLLGQGLADLLITTAKD